MAIAESRLEKGLIWAGTNDGQVQVTRDSGKSWTNVTKAIPNLPPWGTVGNIEPSRYDAATAYLTVDLHQVNNRDPFIYKTTDYGKTWRPIVNGIPKSMLSYAHCIREDPVRRGLLYVGTENAIYVSFDDGDNWQPLQTNMPRAPVYWIAVQEHFNDLVIATYGRGFWILDDLSPLQQLTPEMLAADAHLFPTRAAYRFREITQEATSANDPTAGQNPPYGAAINYYLRTPPTADVTISILDAQNQVIRTFSGPKQAGLNRVYWDLRDEPSTEVRLRTSPLYAPDVEVGPDGTRSAQGAGRISILVPPGSYTVRLNAGGKPLTQKLEVRKDPNSGGTEADIREQIKMLTELRKDLDAGAELANQIELVRAQIQGLGRVLENAEIMKPARELEMKLIDVQQELLELRVTGRGQDGVRFGAQLLSKFGYLANGLASADYRPTDQQLEVHKVLKSELAKHQAVAAGLLDRDLKALNELMRGRGVSNIIIKRPPTQ
jgi:hypothetical protein